MTPCFLIGSVSRVNVSEFFAVIQRVLSFVALVCLGCASPGLHAAFGQSTGAAEWPTGSFNQQRDGWQRNETKFTADNAKDIRLLWKLKTDNKPMGMQSFREPLIVSGVNTASGVKTLAILAGSSNDVYAVDADRGAMIWQKHLKWSSDKPQEPGEGNGFICTNALDSNTGGYAGRGSDSVSSMYSPATVTCTPWIWRPARKKTRRYKCCRQFMGKRTA